MRRLQRESMTPKRCECQVIIIITIFSITYWQAHLGPEHSVNSAHLNLLAAGAELTDGQIQNCLFVAHFSTQGQKLSRPSRLPNSPDWGTSGPEQRIGPAAGAAYSGSHREQPFRRPQFRPTSLLRGRQDKARSLSARAFTFGSEIFLGTGEHSSGPRPYASYLWDDALAFN
jgi:hypothetical protein